MSRAALALLTAVIAACALAACGGSSESDAPSTADFRTQYAPISAEIREVGVDVGDAVTKAKTKTDAELQSEFGDLAERTGASASALEATEPPDDAAIQKARTKLIAGVKQGASDLAAISAAASVHDAKAARAATIELVKHAPNVRDPRLELDKLVLSSN